MPSLAENRDAILYTRTFRRVKEKIDSIAVESGRSQADTLTQLLLEVFDKCNIIVSGTNVSIEWKNNSEA